MFPPGKKSGFHEEKEKKKGGNFLKKTRRTKRGLVEGVRVAPLTPALIARGE